MIGVTASPFSGGQLSSGFTTTNFFRFSSAHARIPQSPPRDSRSSFETTIPSYRVIR